jgi:hypothetical protein
VSRRASWSVRGAGLAAAALLLQGCATATPAVYGPIGPEVPYGYRDRQNPDGGHTILVVMGGFQSVADLRGFFDRRAAELCPAGVERSNVFRVQAKEVYTPATYVQGAATIGSRSLGGIELEGYVYCKPGVVSPPG